MQVLSKPITPASITPNQELWRELVSLVVDGMAFTLQAVKGNGNRSPSPQQDPLLAGSNDKAAAASDAELTPEEIVLRDAESAWVSVRQPAVPGPERTSLIEKALSGDEKGLKQMLKKLRGKKNGSATGSEVDAADRRGYTAFHICCAGGYPEATKALVKAGCNTALETSGGKTGWGLAAATKRVAVEVR